MVGVLWLSLQPTLKNVPSKHTHTHTIWRQPHTDYFRQAEDLQAIAETLASKANGREVAEVACSAT